MSKQRVEEYIPLAYDALEECGIAVGGNIDGSLRSKITSFGAAVTMGSLLAAIAFFSKKGDAKTERQLLMKAIYIVLLKSENKITANIADEISEVDLFNRVRHSPDDPDSLREQIMDAAVAIKLAMNLYNLVSKDDTKNKEKEMNQTEAGNGN